LGGDVGRTDMGLRGTRLAKRGKWASHALTGMKVDVGT
jgi:hypothetical protein